MAKAKAKSPKKSKPKKENYPMHFVGFEGKQVTDSYVAIFSHERPKKVETPLGGETDNSEVFDA